MTHIALAISIDRHIFSWITRNWTASGAMDIVMKYKSDAARKTAEQLLYHEAYMHPNEVPVMQMRSIRSKKTHLRVSKSFRAPSLLFWERQRSDLMTCTVIASARTSRCEIKARERLSINVLDRATMIGVLRFRKRSQLDERDSIR